jgi:hypothetical protein
MIVHFPVVLSVAALAAALIATLFGSRTGWLYAMISLALAGAMIYPIHLTGDKAAHALRNARYLSNDAIKVHDSAAGYAMAVLLVAGAFCAFGWWRSVTLPQREISSWLKRGVLVATAGSAAAVVYTAYLGGLIVHDAPILRVTAKQEMGGPLVAVHRSGRRP